MDWKDNRGEKAGDVIKRRMQQILEEVFSRCKIDYGLFPNGVTEENLRSTNKRAPLVEAYNILRITY